MPNIYSTLKHNNMTFTKKQKTEIEGILKTSLRSKLQNHTAEPASMPFHTRLLGKDRLALYSFIHSLNTRFGSGIFEPIALTLAKKKFMRADAQIASGDMMSSQAQTEIQKIMNGLTTAKNLPDKKREVERIRAVCQSGRMVKVKPTKVDLLCKQKSNEYFLFDIKTAKPNAGAFKEFKRTLLEWAAVLLAENPRAKVHTMIAIPYNPYEPEPYNRWTMRGMLDLKNEIKVAEEFWDFLMEKGFYKKLLDCFERVGIELRSEIDDYFKRFK